VGRGPLPEDAVASGLPDLDAAEGLELREGKACEQGRGLAEHRVVRRVDRVLRVEGDRDA